MDVINLLDDEELDGIEDVRYRMNSRFLDVAIGGGFPRGLIEVYGKESSGKSMLMLQQAGAVLRAGGCALIFDQEDYFQQSKSNMNRIKVLLGIDKFSDYVIKDKKGITSKDSQLIVIRADTLEEALKTTDSQAKYWRTDGICAETAPVFVGHDSLAHTETEAESSRDYNAKEYASSAGVLSRTLKKFSTAAYNYGIVYFVLNQMRDKIGVMWGAKTGTPGGNAVKFAAHIRIQMSVMKTNPDGCDILFQIKKNKTFIPNREFIMPFTYMAGFDDLGAAIMVLKRFGLLVQTGKGYNVRKPKDKEYNYHFSKNMDESQRDKLIDFGLKVFAQNEYLAGRKKAGEND